MVTYMSTFECAGKPVSTKLFVSLLMTRRRNILSRRRFLRNSMIASAAITAPLFLPASVLGRGGAVGPTEKIVFAGIGIGPRGEYDLSVMLPEKDVQFVAVCDIRRERRERIKK